MTKKNTTVPEIESLEEDEVDFVRAELPKMVKIGYQYYEVKKVSDGEHFLKNMDGEVFGMTDYKRATIYIDDQVNEVDEANTLLHEILHAVHFNHGYGCKNAQPEWTDENFVTSGANGLCQVFQDNPELVGYLMINLHAIDANSLKLYSDNKSVQ